MQVSKQTEFGTSAMAWELQEKLLQMEQSDQGVKYAQIIMLTYQVLVYNSKQLAIHDKACKVLDVAQQIEELKNKNAQF